MYDDEYYRVLSPALIHRKFFQGLVMVSLSKAIGSFQATICNSNVRMVVVYIAQSIRSAGVCGSFMRHLSEE